MPVHFYRGSNPLYFLKDNLDILKLKYQNETTIISKIQYLLLNKIQNTND
jgi:hypothetical protein